MIGHTLMRLPLTLPLAALALAAGLTSCTGVGTPTLILQEDDPGWSCLTDGNRICGPTNDADIAAGWEAWDKSAGYASLKVDPSRPYRVDYVGKGDNPALSPNMGAVVGTDFKWHVFAATYLDVPGY